MLAWIAALSLATYCYSQHHARKRQSFELLELRDELQELRELLETKDKHLQVLKALNSKIRQDRALSRNLSVDRMLDELQSSFHNRRPN